MLNIQVFDRVRMGIHMWKSTGILQIFLHIFGILSLFACNKFRIFLCVVWHLRLPYSGLVIKVSDMRPASLGSIPTVPIWVIWWQ